MVDKARTTEQLREDLKNPEELKSLLENPDNLTRYIEDYAKSMNDEGGMEEKVKQAAKEGMEAFIMEHRKDLKGDSLPDEGDDVTEWKSWNNPNAGNFKGGWGTERLTGEQVKMQNQRRSQADTNGFKSPSEYLHAIWERTLQRMGPDQRLKDLSVDIGGDGGFLVPEALRAQLFQIPLEAAIVRPRAMIVPMDSLRVPFPTIDDTSHATDIFGGMQAYWTDENTAITEDQPVFGRVVLEAKKLAVYTEVPSELMQDSIISIEAFLNQSYPLAIGYFEDDAFLNGSGAGRPLGAHSAANPAIVSVTRTSANEVVWDDIVNMYARMLPSSLGNAVWTVNQEVFPQLATMSLNVGTGGSAVWLSNGQAGPPATILGRPVIITEKNAALGSAGDICFTDFRQYLLGDRQTTTMMASTHFRFQQDQTAIRGTERVDGQPWMRSALTPRNGTNTLTAYVRLAA